MTVHVISVGASLAKGLFAHPRAAVRGQPPAITDDVAQRIYHCQPGELLERMANEKQLADVSKLLSQWLGGSASADELVRMINEVKPETWLPWVSAEAATFDRVTRTNRLDGDDIAVLVTTDSADGLSCALWNALMLVEGDLRRVRYLPDPAGHIRAREARGTAIIVRITQLRVKHNRDFADAMRQLGHLGRLLRVLLATNDLGTITEPCTLYLSGGYKAAIPYLLSLAEWLRSLEEGAKALVRAYVIHEETDPDSEPIMLPLRRFRIGQVRRELDTFGQDGVSTSQPKGDYLDGYAYEYNDAERRWILTPFGKGMRAFLGGSPQDAI